MIWNMLNVKYKNEGCRMKQKLWKGNEYMVETTRMNSNKRESLSDDNSKTRDKRVPLFSTSLSISLHVIMWAFLWCSSSFIWLFPSPSAVSNYQKKKKNSFILDLGAQKSNLNQNLPPSDAFLQPFLNIIKAKRPPKSC